MNSAVAAKKQLTIRTIPWIFILATVVVIGTFFTFWSYGQLNIWAVLILLGVIALMAYFGEFVSITFDREQRTARFVQKRIWRQSKREIPFDDFHTISVEETRNQNSDGNSSIFRILFVLKTGESFRQTNFTAGSKASMTKTVQKMVDFINQGHPGVVAALDGVVRIKRDGAANGIGWQIEFVANNDRPMLTRWKTDFGQFLDGFLLVAPNVGGMKMQTAGGKSPRTGWANTAISYVYSMYLETMDLTLNDLPGFNNMEVLKGSEVGLSDQFNVLTNHAVATQTWLTPEKKQRIMEWTQTNPLEAKRGEGIPHFLATPRGFILFFRGNYPGLQQVESITKLGMALIRP